MIVTERLYALLLEYVTLQIVNNMIIDMIIGIA